jgi:hypothetical protein
VYSFTLLLDGIDDMGPDLEDELVAAGCTDALVGKRNGLVSTMKCHAGQPRKKCLAPVSGGTLDCIYMNVYTSRVEVLS